MKHKNKCNLNRRGKGSGVRAGNDIPTPKRKKVKNERMSFGPDVKKRFVIKQSQKKSGAARRRYRKLLSENVSEALKLCKQPVLENPVRRDYNKPKKGMASLRVGIKNVKPMSGKQMKLVHRALTQAIVKMDVKGTGPRFSGLSYKPGWMLVICQDMASLQWLSKTAQNLRPWSKARLSIIQESKITKPATGSILFPKSEVLTVKEALKMITKQNSGLYPQHWKIIFTKHVHNGIFTVFRLDESSVKTLRSNHNKVSLGFKTLCFNVKGGYKYSDIQHGSPTFPMLNAGYNEVRKRRRNDFGGESTNYLTSNSRRQTKDELLHIDFGNNLTNIQGESDHSFEFGSRYGDNDEFEASLRYNENDIHNMRGHSPCITPNSEGRYMDYNEPPRIESPCSRNDDNFNYDMREFINTAAFNPDWGLTEHREQTKEDDFHEMDCNNLMYRNYSWRNTDNNKQPQLENISQNSRHNEMRHQDLMQRSSNSGWRHAELSDASSTHSNNANTYYDKKDSNYMSPGSWITTEYNSQETEFNFMPQHSNYFPRPSSPNDCQRDTECRSRNNDLRNLDNDYTHSERNTSDYKTMQRNLPISERLKNIANDIYDFNYAPRSSYNDLRDKLSSRMPRSETISRKRKKNHY